MSDIPDYIFELLGNETDLSTRRNAFAFLMECKQPLAIEFLDANCDDVSPLSFPHRQISHYGDCFQLVALELIRKVCTEESSQKVPLLILLHSRVVSSSPCKAC